MIAPVPAPASRQADPFVQRTPLRTLAAAVALLQCAACSTPQQTSALECGAGGAAAAFAICKLAGGSDRSCAAITVGVGAVGAGACYAYADHLQKRRQELAGHENDLDARIRYLKGVNQDTEELNRQLSAKLDSVTASTNQTLAAVQSGQADQQALARQRQALDKEVRSAQAQVDAATRELADARAFRSRAAAAGSADLNAQIARLESLLDQAQRDTNALAAQRQRI